MFQQLAGINTVMYYSAKIISMAGITDDTQAIWQEIMTIKSTLPMWSINSGYFKTIG